MNAFRSLLHKGDKHVRHHLYVFFRRLKQFKPSLWPRTFKPSITPEDIGQCSIELGVCEVDARTLPSSLGKRNQVLVRAGVVDPALRDVFVGLWED